MTSYIFYSSSLYFATCFFSLSRHILTLALPWLSKDCVSERTIVFAKFSWSNSNFLYLAYSADSYFLKFSISRLGSSYDSTLSFSIFYFASASYAFLSSLRVSSSYWLICVFSVWSAWTCISSLEDYSLSYFSSSLCLASVRVWLYFNSSISFYDL